MRLPFFSHCTKVNVSDDQSFIKLLSKNLDYFRATPVNIPKVTILFDQGYHPETIWVALKELYPQIMTKIRFKLAPSPMKAGESLKKNWVCPRRYPLDHWAIERVDGAMQESSQPELEIREPKTTDFLYLILQKISNCRFEVKK